MYDGAKKQLEKGDKLFNEIFKPLASLTGSWKYLGFKCFPKVKNRRDFLNFGIPEEELQVHNSRICVLKCPLTKLSI